MGMKVGEQDYQQGKRAVLKSQTRGSGCTQYSGITVDTYPRNFPANFHT